MTHGDPVGRSGRQTPILASGGGQSDQGEPDSTSNTPMSSKMGKMMSVKVLMLDDSITVFQVQAKSPGRLLFDQVCKQLSLLEVDYFGLEYQDGHGITYWLDVEKQLNHQVGLSSNEPLLKFCVKFYTPDPSLIEEEYTRYLFGLQIKRDLAIGQLQCNENTAALMASYIVQAECGDYVVEDYPDHTYLSSFKFIPLQDGELERRIMENHKKGQSPAEADLNLLETARRCELYGVKMHASKDHEGVPLNLAVAHMGVLVFQNYTKINTFSWAKIRKLSFKRKKYLIKLHPEGYGYYKDTVEFYFDDRNQCKNFWKKCVEHHSFFRCSSTIAREREKHRLLSRGSSFRYSGKTQKQMQDFVRDNFVKRQSYQRNAARNIHETNVGQSFSAQPLLPIGDPSLGAISMSCGSVSFGHLLHQQRLGGGLFSQDGLNEAGSDLEDVRGRHDYRSLPHKRPQNYILTAGHLPSYNHSTASTPRRPQNSRAQPVPMPRTHINDRDSLADAEFSAASENTVIEQELNRRSSAASFSASGGGRRSIVSIQDDTGGYLVVQGVSGPVAHVVGIDDPELDIEAGQLSSEDNLSHDSYELIEKSATSLADLNVGSSNQFEKEFYRQAAASAALKGQRANGGPLVSSQGSSHCSLSMSPQVIKRPTVVIPPKDSISIAEVNSVPDTVSAAELELRKVKSQDSFSQASNHNLSFTNLNNNSDAESIQIMARTEEEDEEEEEEEEEEEVSEPQVLQHSQQPPVKQVDIIRGGSFVENPYLYSHSLPRSNAEGYIIYQPQQPRRPSGGHAMNEQQQQQFSRTLPSRRRERSPVYYSRSKITHGGHYHHGSQTGIMECSSGSSSSHASPHISRPKSLDFAVVNANALPNKQAYSFRDDSLEQPPPASNQLRLDPYDDSSSAISGCPNSSSDVPQTPENPNITFLPLEAGPILVGCGLRGLKRYYNPDERIYDVPEGIEGVTDPIKIAASDRPPKIELATSPSSSSGLTEPYVLPKKMAPPSVAPPPPPPPHHPVIAQHVRSRPLRPPHDARKFHSLLGGRQQDSTESCDSNSLAAVGIRPQRASRGRGTGQSHFSTTTLPAPQRALLATMSSTESESAMSARSAPTPISNPDQLVKSRRIEVTEDRDYEGLQVNLISPPAEESEDSTAVLDSEGVPAPPPEFSGAAVINEADPLEATDVEEDSQSNAVSLPVKHTVKQQHEVIDAVERNEDHEHDTTMSQTTTTVLIKASEGTGNISNDVATVSPGNSERKQTSLENCKASPDKELEGKIPEGSHIVVECQDPLGGSQNSEEPKQFEYVESPEDPKSSQGLEQYDNSRNDDNIVVEEEEEKSSSKVIIMADLYVKMEANNGSGGSTISDEGNTGSDIAPVPFIDEVTPISSQKEEQELFEHLDGIRGLEVVTLPTKQHPESIFIPPTPTNVCQSEDVKTLEAPLEIPEGGDLAESEGEVLERLPSLPTQDSNSSIDFEMDCIPPPPAHSDIKAASIDSSSSVSPPPPPPMLLDGTDGPPTAIFTDVGFPFPPRALSRISEADSVLPPNLGSRSRSRSGSDGPDTMTDQNCTTSEDNYPDNPESLNSDLPENTVRPQGAVMRAIADLEAKMSKDLPSPPSSMATTEEVTQEGKTEITLVDHDSLYLEISPGAEEEEEDNNEDVRTKDKVPYDLSISSENGVTHGGDPGSNSEGSLHDSMEILEDIATEDHFETDVIPVDEDDQDSDQDAEPRDIFEMPPMPDTLTESDKDQKDPPPGGNEFIF